MNSLKPREEKAFKFIRAQLKTQGVAPTYDEIAAAIGIKARSNALYVVDELVARGLLRRTVQRWRGLELVQTEDNHAPDCYCDGCAVARHLAQRKLVEALQITPEFPARVWLNGLRPLHNHTKGYWLIGFPSARGDAA
jgi:SOS-response transcriptional repressor LexA